ncbi:MAG: chorismate-binding protein, partial [Ignavibacteriaceae bacterium]|nr:chorismate-binding protein [Ignavibacteriaceae bacterium]
MEDFISNSANTFSTFLSEKEKELKNQVNPYIISFVLNAEDSPAFFEPLELTTNFDLSFFYEKPDEQFSFAALGNCLEITENGSGRFAASVKKIKEWQNSLITNAHKFDDFTFPLFVGGVKFMVEHADENWKDFSDSTWFVPDFLLLIKENKKIFVVNILANPGNSAGALLKKFEAKLQSINSIKINSENISKVELLNVFGNSPKEKKKWKQAVESSLLNIESGEIDKIVLSRKVEFLFSGEQSIIPLQKKLRAAYPNCYNFIFRRGTSYFFGATPERLAKFKKNEIVFEALA